MRVIEPNKRQAKNIHHRDSLLWPILVMLIIGAVWFFFYRSHQSPQTTYKQEQKASQQTLSSETPPKKGVLKTYTSQQFSDLYKKFSYPNTQRIDETTPITGNIEADAKIRQLALSRGYEIRSAPVTDTFKEVFPGMMLQERASQPTLDMIAKAKKDGLALTLTAAYRSAEDQKEIFLGRLNSQKIPVSAIASGAYDAQVMQVLRTTAVPGYSRHHTGYTVDIGCANDPSVIFEKSSCYRWLSAENFKNAKTFGWIPSYPPGLTNQGPDPEPWEFVWVGSDALTE